MKFKTNFLVLATFMLVTLFIPSHAYGSKLSNAELKSVVNALGVAQSFDDHVVVEAGRGNTGQVVLRMPKWGGAWTNNRVWNDRGIFNFEAVDVLYEVKFENGEGKMYGARKNYDYQLVKTSALDRSGKYIWYRNSDFAHFPDWRGRKRELSIHPQHQNKGVLFKAFNSVKPSGEHKRRYFYIHIHAPVIDSYYNRKWYDSMGRHNTAYVATKREALMHSSIPNYYYNNDLLWRANNALTQDSGNDAKLYNGPGNKKTTLVIINYKN